MGQTARPANILRRRSIRVLMVEDDADHAELFQECLELTSQVRFQVVVAPRLADATSLLGIRPDIIVTDLGLPDAVGLQAAEHLLASAPGVPLVVVTNHDDLKTGMAAIEAGAQDFIVKGRHPPEFYGRVLLQAIERKQVLEVLRLRTEDIEAFTYALTHDLKGPLRTLNFTADLVRRYHADQGTDLPTEIADAMARMTRTVAHMERFVEEVLSFASYGAGQTESGQVALDRLIEETIDLLGPYAERCSARLRSELTSPTEGIAGDPAQLRHLVTNLVTNALDHGREEGGEVLVRLETDPEENETVLSVDDNGRGIPDGHLDKIFQPFHRASSGRPGKKGHGLGLAICDRVARNHGATLRAMNRPEGGARFEVRFPLETEAPLRPPARRSPGGGPP